MFPLRLPALSLLLLCSLQPSAAITIAAFDVSHSEDFNSLSTGTGSAVPAGWEFLETGSGANNTYGAGTGSSSTGNTYSFGATNAIDRALGSVRTSSVSSQWGTVITNQTGAPITQLDIQYFGEQWRLGATGRVDRLDFAFSLDATSLATGGWTDFAALSLVGPVTTGTTGALDGNVDDNRVLISATLSGLNLAPGASLWLRWSDFEASGSDDGLAIDDFSVMATLVPAQSVPDHLPPGWPVAIIGALLLAHLRHRDVRAP